MGVAILHMCIGVGPCGSATCVFIGNKFTGRVYSLSDIVFSEHSFPRFPKISGFPNPQIFTHLTACSQIVRKISLAFLSPPSPPLSLSFSLSHTVPWVRRVFSSVTQPTHSLGSTSQLCMFLNFFLCSCPSVNLSVYLRVHTCVQVNSS